MPNIITIGLIRGPQGRVRGREGNGMMEAEIKVVCLEDGVSGHKPRNTQATNKS